MNRRIQSLELMRHLQPFTQGGILSAVRAKDIVDGFVNNDDGLLTEFIFDPHIPAQYLQLTMKLKNFVKGGI